MVIPKEADHGQSAVAQARRSDLRRGRANPSAPQASAESVHSQGGQPLQRALRAEAPREDISRRLATPRRSPHRLSSRDRDARRSSERAMTPAYGHVYVADLNPRHGTEPGKIRPVVVVQTDALNRSHPSTIVCPLTTEIAGFENPLRVALPKGVSGLKRASDVLVDQVKSIDNRRLRRTLGA